MGHARKPAHPVLGRNNLVTLGRRHADQLRRAFRRRHGAAFASGVPRLRERAAHRRHYYGGARPPLRQLHAKLPESYSAPSRCHPSHSRKNRTIPVRSNLRRLVESQCSFKRERRGRPIGATLPARDRIRRELRLNYSQPDALVVFVLFFQVGCAA